MISLIKAASGRVGGQVQLSAFMLLILLNTAKVIQLCTEGCRPIK